MTARTSKLPHVEELDQFYREGGLRRMASPHIHYQPGTCPHEGCSHSMPWIDFQLGDPENVYKPLVRSWWEGVGFAGRCPVCNDWIRFTTLGMTALDDEQAAGMPQLPKNWHVIAQFG